MHKITKVNEAAKMGQCSICGLVQVKFKKARARYNQKARWSCMNVERACNRRYQLSPTGIRYEHTRKLSKLKGKIPETNAFSSELLLTVQQRSQQAICCDCCGELKQPEAHLCLDHNHVTGELRGFICRLCNLGLGHFRDSTEILRKAIQYLENPPLRVK
jgi:hypothetical protein